ncbi:unnamed protein product [Mytilus coruscus]|uniref:BEN domain-containing protein n=1 Tax=Mytilus coruscus TaxID=42192 RepID=A0A6J8BTS4_MYTCO|nr:unnamed protein product [Mytilus coruscus]
MFACIYFEEDKSISVVGKADKDLKLDGEFESRSKCTMKWKVKGSHEKKTYHGTIVRINNSEEQLTEFGNSAVKQVVKKNAGRDHEDILQSLWDYNSNYNKPVQAAKRERKVTTIMQESVLQDKELISQRKKKKENNLTVNKTKKKEVEDKTEKNATEKNKQDENNSILKYQTKPDLGLQFGDLSTDEEESVDLTTTGHKVREASNILKTLIWSFPLFQDQTLFQVNNYVPPVEVLEFFKSLNKPGVKRFIARFCEHFEETTDQEVHQCHQCYENIPSTYHELKAPGSDINKNDDFDVYRSHDNEQWDSDMNSSGTFLTYNGQEDYHHTNPQFNTSTQRPMQINQMSTTPLVQQSPVQVSSVQPSSAHNSPLNKESLEEVKYVKLLEKYEHSVKSDELRRITGRAKKEKNPGYYVVIKLMPLLFSTEGMANSRGQGIKPQKQGDTRSPLDSKKIQTIKAYSEVYCKKNQLKVASESEMNDAITEAVAYSRKKIKKQMKTK